MTVLEVAAGIMELRRLRLTKDKCRKAKGGRLPELWIYGLMELRKIGFALLRQTTRQLVNETTSGAVAGL